MQNDLRIAHVADLHFGHNRTRTFSTVSSLRRTLLPIIPEVDLLLIAGDVFDNALSLTSADTLEAINFLHELLVHAEACGIEILIIKGTTLHDRNQLQLIDTLGKIKFARGARRLTIVDKPDIVRIRGNSFLCLPDDLHFESKEALFDHIQQLLLRQPDHKVDYCVLHGMFDFACQGADHTDSYAVDDFKDIVKKIVMCGHVHRPWVSGNVYYSGSVDRFAHNEEHDKGFWLHDIDKSRFIVNPHAIVYHTYECHLDNLQQICDHHDTVMEDKFKDVEYGYCRVILGNSDLRQAFRKYHLSEYKHITLKFKRIKGPTLLSDDEVDLGEQVVLEAPSLDNLAKIICGNIDSPDVTIDDIQPVLDRLKS